MSTPTKEALLHLVTNKPDITVNFVWNGRESMSSIKAVLSGVGTWEIWHADDISHRLDLRGTFATPEEVFSAMGNLADEIRRAAAEHEKDRANGLPVA